jgi:hypothetical protein
LNFKQPFNPQKTSNFGQYRTSWSCFYGLKIFSTLKQLSFLLIIPAFLFLSCSDQKQNKVTESQKIEFSAESNRKYDFLPSVEEMVLVV